VVVDRGADAGLAAGSSVLRHHPSPALPRDVDDPTLADDLEDL
jgi:hypothetical protein